MADESKIGTHWESDELDLLVADYFSMLAAEHAGAPYTKSHHSSVLMEQIGRTHRSVEFKHMNLSAVLTELGLPTIRGYKPKPNYQSAIFDAVDRFLTANPDALDSSQRVVTAVLSGVAEMPLIFSEPPPLVDRPPRALPPGLQHLVRKFDPLERDFRNRTLGKAGEALVVEFEQRRLHSERPDLSRRVRWVSDIEGDGHGYDIESFSLSGQRRLIEVKTTNGGQTTPFFFSRNEERVSQERAEEFHLYRLYDFARQPKMFELRPPLGDSLRMETEIWRASFG